jgi:hypothetical protein
LAFLRSLKLADFCPYFKVQKQAYPPFEGSYWAGISNVGRQPASILGGGLKMEVQVLGAKQQFSNNLVGLDRGKFLVRLIEAIKDSGDWNDATSFNSKPSKYTAFFGAEAWGPGFTMQLDEKNAFAFGTKGRSISMVHNISAELGELLYNDFLVPEYWLRLDGQTADLQHMTWVEYYGTYARSFEINDRHTIRSGATLKFLQGQVGAFLYLENLSYEFQNDSIFNIYDTRIRYGLSNNPIFRDSTISPSFRIVGNPSLGFDFGVEYEFKKAGADPIHDCSEPPYRLKVGFSVVDIGGIKFTKGPNSKDYYADRQNVPVRELIVDGFRELDSAFNSLFTEIPSSPSFKVQLPMSINLNIDYNIGNGFALNTDLMISPRNYSNFEKVKNITRIQLTPRWEKRWFGAYMPLSLSSQTAFGLGLTLRAGPLIIGTNDLLAYFGSKTTYGQDLHLALKVPLFTTCRKKANVDVLE